MSISFPTASVAIVDGKAEVLVKCSGTTAQRCVGTLTVKFQGQPSKASYSVPQGKKKTIKVPLGTNLGVAEEGTPTIVATARTKQASGTPVKTTRKLHLK
jgi:hypothetical protein